MTTTYWIARHAAPELLHRIPVYSAPPRWIDGEQRWISGDGRAICIIDGEENARALLRLDAIPEPGRCVKLDVQGAFDPVSDVTDELRGVQKETS